MRLFFSQKRFHMRHLLIVKSLLSTRLCYARKESHYIRKHIKNEHLLTPITNPYKNANNRNGDPSRKPPKPDDTRTRFQVQISPTRVPIDPTAELHNPRVCRRVATRERRGKSRMRLRNCATRTRIVEHGQAPEARGRAWEQTWPMTVISHRDDLRMTVSSVSDAVGFSFYGWVTREGKFGIFVLGNSVKGLRLMVVMLRGQIDQIE